MKNLEFRSMDEFKKHYFPVQYEKEKIKKMMPEEYGRYLAEQALERMSRILTN